MLEFILYVLAALYVGYRLLKRFKKPNFAGRTVWITGASSGIGHALSLEFATHGAALILSSRSEHKLREVREECRALGCENVEIVPLDLEDEAAVANRGRDVAAHRVVDVLVHSAGIGQRTLVEETTDSLDIEEKLLTTNALGPIALTKAVLPYMIQHRTGHIVCINSVQGLMGVPMRAAYSASKFALKQFVWSVRAELYFKSISATNIYPGYVQTEFSSHALDASGQGSGAIDENARTAISPQDFAAKAVRAIYWRESEVVICSLKFRIAVFLRSYCPYLLSLLQKRYLQKQLRTRDSARNHRE